MRYNMSALAVLVVKTAFRPIDPARLKDSVLTLLALVGLMGLVVSVTVTLVFVAASPARFMILVLGLAVGFAGYGGAAAGVRLLRHHRRVKRREATVAIREKLLHTLEVRYKALSAVPPKQGVVEGETGPAAPPPTGADLPEYIFLKDASNQIVWRLRITPPMADHLNSISERMSQLAAEAGTAFVLEKGESAGEAADIRDVPEWHEAWAAFLEAAAESALRRKGVNTGVNDEFRIQDAGPTDRKVLWTMAHIV